MAQYIDKSALVAEIYRRRDAALMRQRNLEAIGQVTVLDEMVANQLSRIISFINNLEVREVKEVDLESEMDKYFETMEVLEHENIFEDTFQRIAKHFYELGLQAQKGEGV